MKLLSKPAADAIEYGQLRVSPMVGLELEYLHGLGRIKLGAERVLNSLGKEIGLQVSDEPFQNVIERAYKLDWTRDPFDRVIVAHALLAASPLVTRDRMVRDNFSGAIW